MNQTGTVRVIAVVYNPGDELKRFITTLAEATDEAVQLVVVDNGQHHGVAQDAVAAADPRLNASLVLAGSNLGYGKAANLGAEGSDTPWIAVVNPDVEWSPGSLDELIRIGECTPKAGALGPQIRDIDGEVYPSARELPSLTQGVGHAVLSRWWANNPWTKAYQARQENTGNRRNAGWLSGSCLLLRREAFDQVGGFDPGYFMFFEDVDLGERLGLAGWTNVYVPEVWVTHVGGTSWRTAPAPMIRAHHASALRYLHRRYRRWYHAPVRWAIRIGLATRQTFELSAARRSRQK